MTDRLDPCGLTAEDFLQAAQDLLPRGRAWPRDPDATLTRYWRAVADEYERVAGRDCDVLDEAFPGTALELLPDWERFLGLPDECRGEPETLQQRRQTVVSKIRAKGGQSPGYIIDVADALGYEISIDEFVPFRAGLARAGDRIHNGAWAFAFSVQAPEETITNFRAGQSAAGEPLRAWGNDDLECEVDRIKPAHTYVLFAYGDAA